MFWYPQAPLTAFHACFSFFSHDALEHKKVFPQYLSISYVPNLLRKTANRFETQLHKDKLSICVLSSHLDPIGDQNDV